MVENPSTFSTLHEETEGEKLTIKILGRLDAVSAQETERRISQLIDQNETKLLVLNLGNLHYISSAGLRVLLSLHKKMHALSGAMLLCEPTSQVWDILKISGFDRLLEFAKSPAEVEEFEKKLRHKIDKHQSLPL